MEYKYSIVGNANAECRLGTQVCIMINSNKQEKIKISKGPINHTFMFIKTHQYSQ